MAYNFDELLEKSINGTQLTEDESLFLNQEMKKLECPEKDFLDETEKESIDNDAWANELCQ